jgi:hypothetical protein
MRNRIALLIDIGMASLITAIGWFVPVLISLHFSVPLTHHEEYLAGLALVTIPSGAAGCCLYLRLRGRYRKRDAKKLSIGFAIFTPVSLGVSMVLAPIAGGYAELFLGPSFILPSVFTSIVVIMTLLSFLFSFFSLWVSGQS